MLLSAFGAADLEMRNLVICSLTRAAASRARPSPPRSACSLQVSRTGPATARTAPGGWCTRWAAADPQHRRLRQARLQAGQGLTHAEIGRKLGVSRSWITELIKQHGTLPAPGSLFDDTSEDTGAKTRANRPAGRDSEDTAHGQHAGTTSGDRDGQAMAPHPEGRDLRGCLHRAGNPRKRDGRTREAAEADATTTGTPRVRARPGGWRRGSRPGLSPAAMPGRCWCTPSPTGSAPGLLTAGTGASAAGPGAPVDDLGILVCTSCRLPSAR